MEPFVPCVNCKDTPGLIEVRVSSWRGMASNRPAYRRCPCFLAHQKRVLDAIQAQAKTKKR